MDTDQNWYRQLLALVLLSASRAAVEFITNPNSREDSTKQLRAAFQEIDYDSLANAVTRAIDEAASTSKDRLNEAIDTIRDASVDKVSEVKSRAEKQAGKKDGGRLRFLFLMALGAGIFYYLADEQRRDDLLDRLTGASGPIQQSGESVFQQASSNAQQAAEKAGDVAQGNQPGSSS